MQEKLKNRPAREILEDFAKNLGLEVSVDRPSKFGTSTCLFLKSSGSYVYVVGKDPIRRTLCGWGFDDTDAADDALDHILSASMIYWLVSDGKTTKFTEVDLSSICTVEELRIAIDLWSLKKTSRQYPASHKDFPNQLSC